MPIASRDEVRRLAGGPDPLRVPDAVIDEQIAAADTIVKLFTLKEDWTDAHMEWPALKQAAELIAASYIRQMFKEKDESDRQYKEALSLLEMINRRSSNAGQRQVIIKKRKYKVPGLENSESLFYSSLHRKSFRVGGGVGSLGEGADRF